MQHFLSNPGQLGHLLLSARKRLGLTQAAAAAHVGISQSRLSTLESDPNAISLSQLLSLTALYGLRVCIDDQPLAREPSKAAW